jgi:hypothetical protein
MKQKLDQSDILQNLSMLKKRIQKCSNQQFDGLLYLIIFVFDPLAILLLIAANISLSKPKTMRIAVNVKELDEEWAEINVETEDPQPLGGQPEFVVKNEDPENTVEWSEELEPDKEVRKENKTRKTRKRNSVANTNYGSITDIRKK